MKIKLILSLSFLFLAQNVYAEYILPYPGPMPGNKMYKIIRAVDTLQYYWSWGNIAKTNYYMDLADKYLVEAKTLFEYKQYLLGVDSLKRSDAAWVQINPYLEKSQQEYLKNKHIEQSLVHKQSIERLIDQLPELFTWTPEKEESTNLQLKHLLEESRRLRS